jgi:hypothetical protein
MKTTMVAMLTVVGLVGCDGGSASNPMPGVSMTQTLDEEGITRVEIALDRPASKDTMMSVVSGDQKVVNVEFHKGEQTKTTHIAVDGISHLSLVLQPEYGALRAPEGIPLPDPGPALGTQR